MKQNRWLIGGAGVIGAAMIAVAILSPTTPKRLMNDCEPVTLKEDCYGHPPGTVLGYLCHLELERNFMAKNEEMFRALAAIKGEGLRCEFAPEIPWLD